MSEQPSRRKFRSATRVERAIRATMRGFLQDRRHEAGDDNRIHIGVRPQARSIAVDLTAAQAADWPACRGGRDTSHQGAVTHCGNVVWLRDQS